MLAGVASMQPAVQRQRRVDRHFEGVVGYWKAIYDERTVTGVIYQERQTATLDWIDQLGLSSGEPVLEIGCGAGLTSVALAERGFSVTATDSVPAMIDVTNQLVCDRNLVGRIRTSVVDAHDLPFGDRSYSLVLALGVLPWMHSPAPALGEISRVLRPGGFMLVTADNIWRLHHLLDPRLSPVLAPARHLVRDRLPCLGITLGAREPSLARLDSPRRLDTAIGRAGLERERSATIGFGPFTFLNRPVFSEPTGIRLHRKLQSLADQRVPLVRSMGAHYVVLARKPSRIEPAAAQTFEARKPQSATRSWWRKRSCNDAR